MIGKSLVLALAMMVLLGFLPMAEAQHTPMAASAKAAQLTPELHHARTQGGTLVNGGSTSETQANVATGWYYVHATNCQAYWDGTTTYFYIFPQEGGYWFTTNLVFQNTIQPACQTANWIAINVYNTSGSWNSVFTYPYK